MYSMNKVLLFLLLFATATGFAASELTTVDKPEVDTNPEMPTVLKPSGIVASFKSRQHQFLRDGVKVAALITRTVRIGDKPPLITKFIQFYIDADNWLEIDLDDPRRFFSHFTSDVQIDASEDSVTVTARKARYFEVFFKSTGTFMDGELHKHLAQDYLRERRVTAPR